MSTDAKMSDHTFTPWKVAPRKLTSEAMWKQPLKWQWKGFCLCPSCGGDMPARLQKGSGIPMEVDLCANGCQKAPDPRLTRRPRVCCASLPDWLDDEVPIEWIARLLALIHATPHLTWQLLSKRPQNWMSRLVKAMKHNEDNGGPKELHQWILDWVTCKSIGEPPSNVWLGASVEDQASADERIPQLLAIPALVHFLSAEPLLENLDMISGGKMYWWAGKPRIDWVICGAESGRGARPMQTEWAVSLKDQCAAAGVPFFMKQMVVNGKLSHDLSAFPSELQKRETPSSKQFRSVN